MADKQVDWNHAPAWSAEHSVVAAFGRMRLAVLRGREAGVARLPPELSSSQSDLLRSGLDRLGAGERPDMIRRTARSILHDLGTPLGPRTRQWAEHAKVLGLVPGRFDPALAEEEGRHYLLAQALAMSPKRWADPVHAILYTTLQYALELSLRQKLLRPEPLKTEALLHHLQSALEHRVIAPINRSGAHLPSRRSLDFGTASMQAARDVLAADLAVVVGVRVHGRPVYRVVLFQAKRASAGGRVNLGPGGLRQLDVLLSSGMGWYLLYPSKRDGFFATVRPAGQLFAEFWSAPRHRGTPRLSAFGSKGREAWDLASFVSMAMTSDSDTSLGRLFPDAASAAAALSDGGRQPLVGDVVAYDTTGSLRLRDFIDELDGRGYRTRRVRTLPTASSSADAAGEQLAIRDDPEAPGW